MIDSSSDDSAGAIPDDPAAALFQQRWQLYRKFVDYNLLYHREAYGELHRILVEEVVQPFRFFWILPVAMRARLWMLSGDCG